MRNFAILSSASSGRLANVMLNATVEMEGVPVRCAIIETPDAVFDRAEPSNAKRVLIRVHAFSLNYRDRRLVFSMALKGPPHAFYVVGSEFMGQVLETGPEVTHLQPGDRVMGNNAYPESGVPGVAAGVVSNHASRELQILHEVKLTKVPDCMSNATAAAFSIGAQTAYSMVRRLQIFAGAQVLVTAARSNTSLFAMETLRRLGVHIYAATTSGRFSAELRNSGADEVIVTTPEMKLLDHPLMNAVIKTGGMQFVIDPYSDLHFSQVLDAMASGAKYITCGVQNQYSDLTGGAAPVSRSTGREFLNICMKNLQIMGNCIGTTEDLEQAASDYAAGWLSVRLDSTYSKGEIGEFLDRTFSSLDRFGKVVYEYL